VSLATTVAFVVALVVEIGLPFLAGFWVEGKLDVPWRPFWYGALAYGLAQLALRIPLLTFLSGKLGLAQGNSFAAVLAWAAVLALSAALFELAARYVGYRYLFRDLGLTWEHAVMFGVGMAALESVVVVGLPSLMTFTSALSLPGMDPVALGLSAEEAQQLAEAKVQVASLSPLVPLSAALERILTLVLQAALAALVMQAFTRRSSRWLWYAAGAQFAIALAASLVSTYGSVLLAEAVLALGTAACAYWAVRLRPPVERKRTRS